MSDALVELTKEQKIAEAKELYSKGSRNFLVKSYDEAADQLSQVCALYGEVNGELCDELGMPYLLYAKALIALSMEENKVLEVEDEQDDDDGEEEGDNEENKENGSKPNGKLESIKEDEESSSKKGNEAEAGESSSKAKNSTSVEPATGAEEDEAASNLQLAWETLELASRIFSRQGLNALPNLAEVQTELGNIQFENQILDEARADYEKALLIYKDLPQNTYRRAIAEIHYKIGLTFLLQQMNDEGANELEEACALMEAEIEDIKKKPELTEKDENNIKDMEEIKQEIITKVQEIKETKQQTKDEVRAALDNFMNPVPQKENGATSSSEGSSQASTTKAETSKASDISHLIKRKKPEGNDTDVSASPAKKPATESA